jgi:hypothetical protein
MIRQGGSIMPVISSFYGIVVRMYFFDNKQHAKPHIHVEYGEFSAVFSIEDGSTLAGELPSRQRRLVQAWIELRREDLMADWNLAVNGAILFSIDPLR